jgi:SH3-like domain-containing protein
MRRKRIRGATAVAALAVLLPAAAAAQGEHRCETYAHIIDRDPAGVNIRNAPSAQGRVVGVVKFAGADDEIGVEIAAESNGWFRITGYEHFGVERKAKLAGWVHGSRLGSGLKLMDGPKAKERLLEEPSERSKTLLLLAWDPGGEQGKPALWAELPGGRREKIDYEAVKGAATPVLLACANGYLKVRVHKYQGWVPADRLCGSPVTTCP